MFKIPHLKCLQNTTLCYSFPLTSVINVLAAHQITCILCHHGTLHINITSAGDLPVNMRRHSIETLPLHFKLMPLTHLSDKDLPFMEDALVMLRRDESKVLPLLDV